MKDNENNFQRVAIYGINQGVEKERKKFDIGCKLKIYDPYMR